MQSIVIAKCNDLDNTFGAYQGINRAAFVIGLAIDHSSYRHINEISTVSLPAPGQFRHRAGRAVKWCRQGQRE